MSELRFASDDPNVLEGYLVPFGGSFGGRDSYNTFATRDTDFALEWFPEGRPLLWQHGLDGDIKIEPVGRIRSLELRESGVWMKAQLDAHNRYLEDIKKLIAAGALGLSSGAMAHLVEIDDATGEWKRWPIVEGSLTPTPSNLLATIDTYTFASAARSAIRAAGFEDLASEIEANGIETPESIRAKMDAKERDALPDSDFAYIDSKGGRHLPINDADHVKAALARFDQTEFESDEAKQKAKSKIAAAAKTFSVGESSDDVAARSADMPETPAVSTVEKSFEDIRNDICDQLNPSTPYGMNVYSSVVATCPDHVIVQRCEQDEDGCEDTFWRIPYTLDDTNEPVLGTAEPVEQAYVPAAARSSTGPLSLDAHRFIRHAATITERTQDLCDRRVREGRILSAANRRTLTTAHEAMGHAHASLGALLDTTVPQPADEARASDPEMWTAQLAELELLDLTALL